MERQEMTGEQGLVQKLRQWQEVEDDTMQMTREIQLRTESPLLRLVMEIIAHDSAMHRRVQQFIIDCIVKKCVSISAEDLEIFREVIEKHAHREKNVIAMAEQARESTNLFVARYLLNYLLEDERKHDLLLDQFENNRGAEHASIEAPGTERVQPDLHG